MAQAGAGAAAAVPLIRGQLGHSPSLTAQPPEGTLPLQKALRTCTPRGGWRPRGLPASYNWSGQPSRVCQLTERQHRGADGHNLSKIRGGDWTQREAEKHSRSWAEQGLRPLASHGSSIVRGAFRATPHSLPTRAAAHPPSLQQVLPQGTLTEQGNRRTPRPPGPQPSCPRKVPKTPDRPHGATS